MLDIGRRSPDLEVAAIKKYGRTRNWGVALQLLREGIESGVQLFRDHYVAAVSACRTGGQWQCALLVLSKMWEAKLEPDVIWSYSAGISACEKGEQWQRALALLSELREAELEPDSATAVGSARARKAVSGSRLWRC
ncbi:unnamed protein product [Prorocentrum cordatum]|uniref:Uncharacterized protein n=1 Tax=Prorocentrum cordatum TaxID=2364126 RepID=A0ABN9V2F5_9DINO|nr:unnamed protein product [Polarella glacialis]